MWHSLFQLETEAQKDPANGSEVPKEAASQAGLKDKDSQPFQPKPSSSSL